MNVYFAGSLFTLAERQFNLALADQIRSHDASISVFLPQACDGDLLHLPDFARRIYARMMEAIEGCDAVVAMLDGVSTDSGTCIELGYARALGKKIVGVRTDFRGVGAEGLCPMTAGVCDHLVCQSSTSAKVDCLAVEIVAALQRTHHAPP